MDQLLLRFSDAEISTFEYCVIGNDERRTDGWQSGEVGTVQKLLSRSNTSLILVLPQQVISHFSFDMPTKMSRQLLASIQYQIEDRLAIDVEDLHFVVADSEQNPVSIIVVTKQIMQSCIEFLQTNGLKAESIIPEFSLCPWFGNPQDVSVMETGDGYVVRHHSSLGFKTSPQTLEYMLKNLAKKQNVELINYFGKSKAEFEEAEISSFEMNFNVLYPLKAVDTSSIIELQQGEFSVSSPVTALMATWRWTALLAFALLFALGFNRAMALFDMQSNLDQIRQNQWQLIEDVRPGLVQLDDNYKIELIKYMQENRATSDESGPLNYLFQFGQVFRSAKGISISRMNYQDEMLQVDIEGNQLTNVESLQLKLSELGLQVTLENLNIKPDQITARVVVTGNKQ